MNTLSWLSIYFSSSSLPSILFSFFQSNIVTHPQKSASLTLLQIQGATLYEQNKFHINILLRIMNLLGRKYIKWLNQMYITGTEWFFQGSFKKWNIRIYNKNSYLWITTTPKLWVTMLLLSTIQLPSSHHINSTSIPLKIYPYSNLNSTRLSAHLLWKRYPTLMSPTSNGGWHLLTSPGRKDLAPSTHSIVEWVPTGRWWTNRNFLTNGIKIVRKLNLN